MKLLQEKWCSVKVQEIVFGMVPIICQNVIWNRIYLPEHKMSSNIPELVQVNNEFLYSLLVDKLQSEGNDKSKKDDLHWECLECAKKT